MTTGKAAALTIAVLSALWLVATRPLARLDAAPMTRVAPLSPELEMQITAVAEYRPQAAAIYARRNLFAYVNPPAVVVAPVPPTEIERVPPPLAARHPEVEPLPRFDARYLGRFGRDDDPIAAFAADGQVLTVRRGDRIGDHFTLQSVGLESVAVVDDGGRVLIVRPGTSIPGVARPGTPAHP